MKKIVLALFIAAISFGSAKAQTEKGTWLLGGQVAFTASTTTGGGSQFLAAPQIGAFVADNIAVGGEFNLLTGGGTTAYGVLAFVRPYFGESNTGKFFVQGKAGFAGVSQGGFSNTNFGFGGGLGYAVFLNQTAALELAANYTNFGAGSGLITIGAGFQIHLKK